MRLRILFLFLLILPIWSAGQTIPVGTPVLEDAYRRAQLLGELDSSVSFLARPFSPTISFKRENSFDPTFDLSVNRFTSFDGTFHFDHNLGLVQLLPVTVQLQRNTHHPYSMNDGPIIPARGYQQLISAGLFAQYGPLTIQLRPEWVKAQNKDFEGFSNENSDQKWYEYYEIYNFIDLPEKFGHAPYQKSLWGQSSIRLNYGPMSMGLSSENLWWGPGKYNSLSMSNSADGFFHFTLNTSKPIHTPIGSFEGQIIAGRLVNSGFTPPDTTRKYLGNLLYFPKRDEKRYINGMVLTYQPKWVPGLFIGLTRSFTSYRDSTRNFRETFPIFFPMNRKYEKEDNIGYNFADQRVSAFVRWLFVAAKGEVYFEYMREDHPHNFRDMMLQMEYSRSYLFGLSKIFTLNPLKKRYIEVNFEMTQLEQTNANPDMPYRYTYTSRATTQGYTNNGQLLGAAIGPGSNMQTLGVKWFSGLKVVGLQFDRYVHNNDFHNVAIKDIRANWVDLAATGSFEWNWRNLLFSLQLQGIQSFNYQHRYEPLENDPEEFWKKGRNVYNFQAQSAITYRF